VPFVHVGDVPRSAAFDARFGFEARHTREGARAPRVMVTDAEALVPPG
jgi:hypothetical protein